MIRKFGATGIDSQPQGLDLGLGGGSNIKSIQQGSVSFAAADISKTVTITAVNTGACLVSCNNVPASGAIAQDSFRIDLTNSTTITISRTTSGTAETVNWVAEEYNNVKSFQSGVVTPNLDNQNITVSTVNPLKCHLVVSFKTSTAQTSITYIKFAYTITNATTLNLLFATGGGTSGSYSISWQLIEFN